MFFLGLIKLKGKIKNFFNLKRKNDLKSFFLEDIISSFSHKIEQDTKSIGHLKYVGNDINYLVKQINNTNFEIYKSLDLLKAKQNNISKFMIELNKKVFQRKKEHKDLLSKINVD